MVRQSHLYNLLLLLIFHSRFAQGNDVSKSYSSKNNPDKNVPDILTLFNNNFADVLEEHNYFVDFSDIPENCTKTLEIFTDSAVNLTRCYVTNARPFRLCRSCDDEFSAVNKSFGDLKSLPDVCQIIYFGSDKLSVINTIFNQAETLWNGSSCQSCTSHFNETVTFFKLCDELDICIHNSNKTSEINANGTCDLCRKLYADVSQSYKGFTINGTSNICMDIVDKMNITRRLWAGYQCGGLDKDIGYPNVLTAVLVGTMPLFFYLLAKNVSIIEDVKIVRPKRKSLAPVPSSRKN